MHHWPNGKLTQNSSTLNTKDYTSLLNKPFSLNERQTAELEKILSEFPFLQSARAIYLKGLYNQDSFRYNTELKKTAAYTTDRSVLFDFITSEQFQSVEKKLFEEKERSLEVIDVNDSEVIIPAVNKLEESIKQSLKASEQAEKIISADPVVQEEIINRENTEEKLDIGKPLEFSTGETHSFAEWLQLSKFSPINREEEPKQPEADDSISKKMELIDRFIETNPKIVPAKTSPSPLVNIDRFSQDSSSLMTETLARVYLEQKKYSKAIQAYEILILKYPEKSVFFADRISDIKILQQNNN
jgi:tetratricopeptide (TPR) repeat protein